MLDIRLFGSPEVTVDERPIEVDTRKAIAMLAYLAIEASVDRDVLAALFWADSPPDRARATLRRTLSALRNGIGSEAIDADRNRVRLTPGYRCDIHAFNDAIDETTTHDHPASDVCPRCIAPLELAAGLYRDDFLGAFSIRDAPDFEDWARPVAESYRLRAGDAFQRLAMAFAGTGDYTSAINAAVRWIELDELHEPAHRLLMLLNAWAGDRPGAIQAYRQCVAVLERELGVAPLEETTELYEAILDEDLPPAPSTRRSVRAVKATAAPTASDMLDREDAVQALQRALDSEGRQLCLITGDSWMGKTRLLAHVIEQAVSRGLNNVAGRAFRAEGDLAFGVATQLLRGLMAPIDGDDLPPWAVAELARLDPRLAHGQAPTTTERLGQLRLREAFVTLVQFVAGTGQLVITVDDAQWMDTATAELLGFLLRRLESDNVLIVVSTRDVESIDPSLREIVVQADLRIDLAPLEVSDISHEFPGLDLGPIVEAAGGIPLLVQEAVESGSVAPDSMSVTRYLEMRRERLSDLARQVMAAAAVLDGLCEAQLLRDTSGRTDDEIVEAVEELAAAGLLREDPDGHLGFTLDVLESITYESTSLVRRRLLHRRAAEALETRPRSRSDVRIATAIAGHLRAAGEEEAAAWYRLSGDLARAVFANTEAVSSYETAIALGHVDLGGLHLALGELAMGRGEYQTATRELRAAAALSSGPDLALVEHRLGDLQRILGRFELAEESFTRASEDHPEPASLFADWALLRHRTGDATGAIELADTALESALDDDADDLIAHASNVRGVVSPDPNEALAQFDRALQKSGPTDPGRMAALNNKAHRLAENGDLEDAVELVQEAIALADRSGYRHHQAALLNHLADLMHQSGREDEAEESLKQAVSIFAEIDAGDWEPEVWLLREW